MQYFLEMHTARNDNAKGANINFFPANNYTLLKHKASDTLD